MTIALTLTRKSRLDIATEATLALLLLFMPLALGAVEAWSQMVAAFLGGVLAVLVALRLVTERQRTGLSWAFVPIVLFLLLVLLQLTPLPASIVRIVSPATASRKVELLGDQNWMPLSFYPHATRQTLRLVLLSTVIFATVVTRYRDAAAIRRLLTFIAIIGGIVAALALAQDLSRASGIYWHVRTGLAANSGPFVNHSHYAQ